MSRFFTRCKNLVFFGREVSPESSDILQNIIACYLKASLTVSYRILLEHKRQKIRPDIIIYYEDNPHFIVEIKTTIGWDRKGPEERFDKRIKRISEAFQVPGKNVIYIFESPQNTTNEFESEFWNKENNSPKKSFKYPYIYPLYYDGPWLQKEDFKGNKEINKLTKGKILKRADENIITDFNEILNIIRKR